MTERESGYYWVRVPQGKFEPARFFAETGYWRLLGLTQGWRDTDFAQIGPRIEDPRNG